VIKHETMIEFLDFELASARSPLAPVFGRG
jgi:hypothetical protein